MGCYIYGQLYVIVFELKKIICFTYRSFIFFCLSKLFV